MKMNKKTLPIATICAWKKKIDSTPDYQRPPVWSRKQKQLLIDSILREYDIPKMYWRSVNRDDGVQYEVIDGQQRLRAIWEFHEGGYGLSKDIDPIQDILCANLKYSDLCMDISTIFDSYAVDVVIVDGAIQTDEEDEIRDMFLRLQNGTTLKAQEKRNAMSGQMRNFVKEVSKHSFFENCKFTNSRFTFDHVASQMICLEMAGDIVNIRDSDLNRMYSENTTFDVESKVAKKVRRVLDYLCRAFPEKTPELERYNAITLYCLASILIERYVHHDTEHQLAEWFIKFETARRENDLMNDDKRDPSLIEYKRLTSYSTDGEDSIRGRVEYVEKLFFSTYPAIELKDKNRTFSHEQRLAIYRRGNGACQIKLKCGGDRVSWGDWQADHIIPYAKGGKTTVENGQIACSTCNIAKSDRMD